MRRTVAESTDIKSSLGLWLRQAGYSTGALAQAMRDGAPHAEEIAKRSSRSTQCCFLRDCTKLSHVNHFGTIDGSCKHTFAARGKIRRRDLEQEDGIWSKWKIAIGLSFTHCDF
jgi:hypothetical protein